MFIRRGYKKVIIFCLIIGSLFVTQFIANAHDENAYSKLGSLFRNDAIIDAENDDVIAELFNRKITQEQIDSMKKGYEILGVQKDEDESFRSIVVDLLLAEEANEEFEEFYIEYKKDLFERANIAYVK